MKKLLLNELKLVYPPISNQEGVWLWEDSEVREYVKKSKLYMIGHRKELKFKEVCFFPEGFEVISFRLELGETVSPTIKLCIKDIMMNLTGDSHIQCEFCDKLIKIKDEHKILYWATPDSFLFQYSRNGAKAILESSFDLKVFSHFELYYVGISKENDSFSRLFKQAHKGRLNILSNETQKVKESRLTDELMIFMFDIDSININSVIYGDEILDDEDFYNKFNYHTDDELIIADAEKAFVKLMNTKHNEVKYLSYPEGKDGLYGECLDRYSYSIDEDIIFSTDAIEFVGALGIEKPKDIIIVDGDIAEIIKLTT